MTQSENRQAFLFDLDGTLVDSVYQHVLAWREALESGGIQLAVWRIHRQIGMSGGLFINALLRETGLTVSMEEGERLQQITAKRSSVMRHRFGRFQALRSSYRISQTQRCHGPSQLAGVSKAPVFHFAC